MIAYLRDYALHYGLFAESFETSCAWSNVSKLVHNVKDRIKKECEAQGIKKKPFVTARVT